MSNPSKDQWVAEALTELLQKQNPDSGWGYDSGKASSAEPTALACLAILAHKETTPPIAAEKVDRAAAWLASIQQPNGATGISASIEEPCWPTAYSLIAWTNLPDHRTSAANALQWLLNQKGEKGPNSDLFGHDPKLQGWPWLSETHSWIEPTAASIVALRRAGLNTHPRTQEGVRLILDRAITTGGWNYGNKTVLGRNLRPQPATTGLVLMALSDLNEQLEPIDRACSYLSDCLLTVRSPMSLCWGLLGLTAWNQRPDEYQSWLQQSYGRVRRFRTSTVELAYLLIATSERSWDLFAPLTLGSEV